MAITIRQSPTSPNMVNADLIYEISSNLSSNPQYQFVCDVQDANRSVVQRIKQQPNPSGYGVFDLGMIMANYLDIDTPWKTTWFATGSNSAKAFWVAFGEEYGTSTSGSTILYNGSGVVGNPAKSGSAPLVALDGLVEPNAGYWNWPSASYYTASVAPTGGPANFSKQHGLSYAPTTQKIENGDYATIAWIDGNTGYGVDSADHAQDVYWVEVKVYNTGSTNIQTFAYYNTVASGGWPRTASSEEWPDVYNDSLPSWRLMYAGVGPANFSAAGNALNTAWSYYTVTGYAQESAGVEDTTAYYWQYRFNKQNPQCISDGVRFAWKNEFGVWDYYTATLAINSRVQIERNAYDQSFVNFSTDTTSVPYNISRRGTQQFYNKLNQSFNVTTDILNQADAEWLRELFFSTQVYVQEGTEFVPVVISNPEVIEKTNKRSQKVFQYAFDYRYANQLRPRL